MLFQAGCASKIMLYPQMADQFEREYPVDPKITFSTVEVKNRFGRKITGWMFDKKNSYGSIIVAGGNAMGLGRSYDYNKYLLKTSHRILIISYQGYGKNEGKADLDSLISDTRSFYRHLKFTYKDEPIFLVGISIGASAGICSVSDEITFEKIIAESAVNLKTVAFTKAKEYWPLFPIGFPLALLISLSVPDELDLGKCISEIDNIPILFIHHKKDKIAPYGPSKELYLSYRGPKLFLEPTLTGSGKFHLNVRNDIELQKLIFDFLIYQ
jgi:hypothetical protein